jgi:hypothetical protein
MTLFEVSAADKYSVSTVQKTVQDIRGLYPPRAHHPYHPYIRRILHPAHTRCVGSSITAPVAKEAEYPWFVFHALTPSSFLAFYEFEAMSALLAHRLPERLDLRVDLLIRKPSH